MKKGIKHKEFEGMDRRSFLKGMTLGAAASFVVPAAVTAQSGSKAVQKESGEKIDMFCHVLPQKYKEELFKKSRPCYYLEADRNKPALFDLDMRFRDMENNDSFIGLPFYFISLTIRFLHQEKTIFDNYIINYVRKNKKHSTTHRTKG